MTVNTNGENTMLDIQHDGKGRPIPQYMTDREIIEAILHNQRAVLDLVNEFADATKNNPMLKAMLGKR